MSTGSSDKSSDPPTPQSPGPDPVHDLPEEVLRAGWRRFWSKREKRWYYFNKMTGESLWEMPVVHKSPHNGVPGGSDRITDPLGISVPDTPTDVRSPPPFDLKRRRDSEASITSLGSMSPSKRMKMEGPVYWNFDILSNAIIFEHPPCTMPPVHPEAESYRAQLTNKLRSQYQELCQTREGIDAPRESFNRWILERKVMDRGNDPMLPTHCAHEVSPSMYREIMSDIPVRGCRLRHPVEARKYVFKYAEAAKKMVESRNCSPDSRKIVKWSVEDIMQWLRRQNSATLEDYQERLTHLKTQCGPHLTDAAKSSVEGICQKIYHLSCESAKKIYDKHWEILKEHGIEEIQRKFEVHKRRVQCYQIHMVVSCPRLPSISYHVENNVGCLRFKGEVLTLNQNYLQKLEHLYRIHCRDDRPLENFLPRVWCLLRRYQGFADSGHDFARRWATPGRGGERSSGGNGPASQTLFGSSPNEGTGLQGALPVPVFEAVHKHFGVTFELFASPLNCYFRQYCSAFPDTDGYFGSRGPVLDFHPVSGSFEANPPFSEELLNAMAEHFERLLATSSEPLSFLVFIPEWRDPPIPALLRMENSIFKRKTVVVPAFEHEYRSGLQHVCSGSDLYHKSVHGTLVLILQNEAGFAKWGPTDERVKGLLDAYKPQGNPSPSTSASEGRRESVDGKSATESRSNSKEEKR
ncbi:mRNA (2'-O-methyladenosine-N(6)-)-methyltransferase-like isoform X1 [Branchiostoma floridae]|uniref:mRNA (2'-O-methyladenosine-N(6)-)-methyltransferase-like isoform X1 n=1 Tax=Branchiostoma floridae TaxID=7739 RepID=A0A9J7MUE3_BRAFL|nr:mRNA (2'-O-methyladenosine-N(6)-)-methyltransferase-like isoform X1 [Branchiostoma floridae]